VKIRITAYLFTLLALVVALLASHTAEAKHKRAPVKPVYAKSTAVPGYIQAEIISELDNLDVTIYPDLTIPLQTEEDPLSLSLDFEDTPHICFLFDFFTVGFHPVFMKSFTIFYPSPVYDILLSIQLPPPNSPSFLS
jgi:hypothetical protein